MGGWVGGAGGRWTVWNGARARPRCGVPGARGIRQAGAGLTETEGARSARQQQAAAKLRVWGERYKDPEKAKDQSSADDTFLDRHWKTVIVFFVAIIVILQLTWVFSLFAK